MKVWVVYGDDHDYDCMSQWLVGAYSTEELAKEAEKRDLERYVINGGRADRARYSIDCTEVDEDYEAFQ